MNSKKNLKRNLLICLLAGSAVMYTLPLHAATSVIGNNTLPTGGSFVHGNGSITSAGLEMNVIQNGQNAVIKWGSFDVGGSATVNFSSKGAYANNFNTLNYVNSASASQIYGTINAQGGNIFIVNPAGVQIGNSAQINVGSLYVSNNEMNDDNFNHFMNNADPNNIIDYALQGKSTEAALMSLGNINANHVTFEGNGRIVIDSERIKNAAGSAVNNDFEVHTNHAGNVLIGYDAYVETDEDNDGIVDGYKGQDKTFSNNVYVNGALDNNIKGYMWVEDVKQLQAIDTNLGGNYVLRNSIDGTQANNFTSIGSNTAFTGNFDGIDYNIFNLSISGTDNVGLFGKTDGATINNVTLVGGSITGTGSNVGAIVGSANNTTLTNVVNSAAVSGVSNVGGIVGSADGTTVENAINTGTIEGNSTSETNVGGLIGEMKDSNLTDNYSSELIGNSYNLGDVSGNGHNVGGLVGSASNSTIGNPSEVNDKPVENIETVYNRMDVTGAYNVGGIVGNMAGSTVQNAENSGTVLASGHYDGEYTFHTDYTKDNYSAGGSKTVSVNVANVGGIAGTSSADSTITDVLNTGDVSSSKVKEEEQEQEYYAAGNVGGIVGSAVDTNITNATNRENEVRGAHNVGGVAGYFGSTKGDSTNKYTPHYTVTNGINDGGDIMATGARYEKDFVRETIRHDYNAAANSNNDGKYIVGNIGGIIGTNNGNMYSGYNESIVSGANNVGGIIGTNAEGKKVENVVNATGVEGDDNVGGLVGVNSGSVTNGRNNGTITGNEYVGGLVGNNASENSVLTNLVNDSSASITGVKYVGGIAGSNAGTITADKNNNNLINRGSITGYQYVGGVAGLNTGTITNTNNDVELHVNTAVNGGIGAQYFGGVVGQNGTDLNDGIIENAMNSNTIIAPDASYVGGIVGWNTSQGKLVGMGNSNEGTVIGGSYVGGVIGKNDAAIGSKDSAQVGITNEGTVIATKGGAGGLIGENNAAITNTVMINRGEVHGNNTANDNSGTGGIIGVNMGDITYSSLINEVTGTVTGTNNVGGLIGVNKADITGGRYTVTGEDAGMYINKIYNNGVINVGTYKDEDGDGKYVFYEQAGSNIGGLIGDNQGGSLTAGYNTGAINAKNSSNVGGIAGRNSGKIDQVFNTVMVKPGSNQDIAITGGSYVGGLVGNNQANGEITNAYNTSNVVTTNQDGIVGNLVGTNSGTVQYVYGVADKLIGNGNAAEYDYVIDGSDKWLQEGTYDGFTFGANGWKIYNGSTLPMLSVFLTKVTVVDQHLVNQYFSAKHYGELHQITADDIKALIAIGAISAPDGFGAFNNNNGLIQGVADDAMANSGNWLYSQQILGSNINGLFNPNNLGYDISLVYSPFENEDWPNNHWNYLFNDAPFDRNKDFRERKAEVNFVDGGMEI